MQNRRWIERDGWDGCMLDSPFSHFGFFFPLVDFVPFRPSAFGLGVTILFLGACSEIGLLFPWYWRLGVRLEPDLRAHLLPFLDAPSFGKWSSRTKSMSYLARGVLQGEGPSQLQTGPHNNALGTCITRH